MYIKIIQISDTLLSQSEKYFTESYKNKLLQKVSYKESIIARYLISKYIESEFGLNNYLPVVDNFGAPFFTDNIYWSISHKDKSIFIGVGKKQLGIDLEIFKQRDVSLLDQFSMDEYNILGGKKWEIFYILWTCKESVVKYLNLKLDDIKKINICSYNYTNIEISGILFEKELIFQIGNKNVTVLNGFNQDLFFSICT